MTASLSDSCKLNISVLFLSLECAKGLHLYNGRCYSRCPDGTYANEISMERSSRRRNLTIFSEGSLSKRQDGSLKSSALEALDMEPYANSTKDPLICLPCHYTCATCAGPHDSQCVSCLDDAELFNSTDSVLKFYCYPKKVVSQISDVNWHYRLNVVLSLVLFCICFISLYFIISWTLKWFYGTNNYNSNIAYNKLSSDEKQQSASEVEEEIRLALKDYSEGETEDDLNL